MRRTARDLSQTGFDRRYRIEPESALAAQWPARRARLAALNLKKDVRDNSCCPFASWPFQPKSQKRYAPPFVRVFMDSRRTPSWLGTLLRAVTACAHSSWARTAEFFLSMIDSRALNHFHSLAQSIFTRMPALVMRRTLDFLSS